MPIRADIQIILYTFNDKNIGFKDMEQVNEVMQLVMELSNNIVLEMGMLLKKKKSVETTHVLVAAA